MYTNSITEKNIFKNSGIFWGRSKIVSTWHRLRFFRFPLSYILMSKNIFNLF